MLIIGLTGGIASGKSTVSNLLKSHHIPIVDLDLLARQAVLPSSPALKALTTHFGPQILHPDGTLNREVLGGIVFESEKERKVLNGIVHPAVRKLLYRDVVGCWIGGEKVVVVDAPLLIEAGLWKFCGMIVVVYCSEELQLQRLQQRNSLPRSAAQARLTAQAPLHTKLPYADTVLDNSGGLPDLERQVNALVLKLHGRTGGWGWWVCWVCPPVGMAWGVGRIAWRLWWKGVGKPRKGRKSSKSEAGLGDLRGKAEAAGTPHSRL